MTTSLESPERSQLELTVREDKWAQLWSTALDASYRRGTTAPHLEALHVLLGSVREDSPMWSQDLHTILELALVSLFMPNRTQSFMRALLGPEAPLSTSPTHPAKGAGA